MDSGKFSYQALKKTLEDTLGSALSPRVAKVLQMAYDGHAGQYRTTRSPQHRLPFIIHPVGTARLVIQLYPTAENVTDDLETVVCVALAHDLLEDSRLSSRELEAAAGPRVRACVEALTKPPAAVAGRSASERNSKLGEQIVRGGPTAMFVKVCDSMHNLSGPAVTPLDLLSKAVEKARGQYLPLLEKCPLGGAVKVTYSARIAETEHSLDVERKYIRGGTPIGTLDDAVRECVLAVEGKMLELHDIAAVLRKICGTEQVAIWRLESLSEGTFSPVVDVSGLSRPVRLPASELLESAAVVSGGTAQRVSDGLFGHKWQRVVTVPLRIDAKTVFLVAIGFPDVSETAWLTKEAATALVSFLTHRLVLSEADRRGRLASEAATLGIRLDADLAARVGVEPAELAELHRWRGRCEQARAIVVHAVEEVLMRLGLDLPLAELVTVESRVKPVDSILRKMQSGLLSWPGYQGMEDIAGVRVVCPSQVAVGRIEREVLGGAARLKLRGTIAEARRDFVATPAVSGYRGIHLILEVETVLGDEGVRAVPCELQLRTMFQDTWAKMSHATLYKGHASEKQANWLRRMGKVLEECDDLSQKLILGESSDSKTEQSAAKGDAKA